MADSPTKAVINLSTTTHHTEAADQTFTIHHMQTATSMPCTTNLHSEAVMATPPTNHPTRHDIHTTTTMEGNTPIELLTDHPSLVVTTHLIEAHTEIVMGAAMTDTITILLTPTAIDPHMVEAIDHLSVTPHLTRTTDTTEGLIHTPRLTSSHTKEAIDTHTIHHIEAHIEAATVTDLHMGHHIDHHIDLAIVHLTTEEDTTPVKSLTKPTPRIDPTNGHLVTEEVITLQALFKEEHKSIQEEILLKE